MIFYQRQDMTQSEIPVDHEGVANEGTQMSAMGPDPEAVAALKSHAQRVMTKLPLLGAVSWLLMQQASTRHVLLSELEWRVMPALVLEQAKLYLRDGAPLAYVSWARLSPEVADRYQRAPHHLAPADWRSGEQIWLVDLCAPFGGALEIVRELQDQTFAGQTVHRLRVDQDLGDAVA